MLLTGIMFICFPLLFGAGICLFINGRSLDKEISLWEIYLYGFTGNIGVFEIGHLAGVFADCSLKGCGRIILGIIAAASIFSVVCLMRKPRNILSVRKESHKMRRFCLPQVGFLLLLTVQICMICIVPMMETSGDITLETVNSFLITDKIYNVSPLTGKPFSGTPLRFEILCLPTVYALLCRWSGIAPEFIIGNVVPVTVVGFTYMAYYLLGTTLFDREKDYVEKRWWFMFMVAVIFLLCENAVYMEGYGILHAGHTGTAIRNSVLIPLTLYAALEKKWLPAMFCILTEACIVWTFWGFGICAVIFAGVLIIDWLLGWWTRRGIIDGSID